MRVTETCARVGSLDYGMLHMSIWQVNTWFALHLFIYDDSILQEVVRYLRPNL